MATARAAVSHRQVRCNGAFTLLRQAHLMTRYRTIGEIEADLIALRAATERAGMSLACLFSSSAEYEADLIRERRAQGAYQPPRRKHWLRSTVLIGVLSLTLLLL